MCVAQNIIYDMYYLIVNQFNNFVEFDFFYFTFFKDNLFELCEKIQNHRTKTIFIGWSIRKIEPKYEVAK